MQTAIFGVLGGYAPDIPENVYREQWEVTGSDEEAKERFGKLVLVEGIIDHVDERFKTSEFGHSSLTGNPSRFMCAYDEALTSSGGKLLLAREMNFIRGTGPLRFAFYLHFYDPDRPLHWSYGQVQCPPVQPVPDRVKVLVPYIARS